MKVSDYIIQFISDKGTDTIFSMSGGMITHLEDSVFLNKKMKLVSIKHEQAGAFAAEGYSRSTGKTGIAMGTSGPGATNMITGVSSAFFDSVPVIYLTGQVNTNEITKNVNIRQTGFQEADIISMTKEITKFSYQITDSKEIKYILEKSFFLANYGRRGPVLLDIPMNIQREEIIVEDLASYFDSDEYKKIIKSNIKKEYDLSEIIEQLEKSKKPIVLVGGGLKFIKNKTKLIHIIEKLNLPVISSLMGLDIIDHNKENYIGMIGSYGNRHANIALMNSDLVLVLGSRLDIRQTGADKNKFIENKIIIHVDIDKNELGYNINKTQFKINLELDVFLNEFSSEIKNKKINIEKNKKWLEDLIKIKSILNKKILKKEKGLFNPIYIFNYLSTLIKKDKIIINDVGQNQMISSTSFILNQNDQMLNSGGLGSMGFSLPTSIGATFGNKDNFIISVNGDGGFQMNIQELETIKHHNLPILIIVLNNNSLGMVREFQDSYFGGRNIGTVIGYSCPNLSKIANAYGIDYLKLGKGNLKKILEKASDIIKPTILEILMDEKSSITKVMFGNTIDNQSPELNNKLKEKINKILI